MRRKTLPKFDFGSLKTEDHTNNMIGAQQNVSQKAKKSRISTETLQQEINKLKRDLKTLKQERSQKSNDLPEEVYKGLWLMCRSFRSQYRNKSDSMLGSLTIVMNHFDIDLDKNPFDKLKGSEI